MLVYKFNNVLNEETSNNIVFEKNYDVIVAGMGTAGAIATIVAAKEGLNVIGIERLNCMGGMGTAGAVNNYYFGSPGGCYEEIDEKVNQFNTIHYTESATFSIDSKKFVLEQEAVKYGAKLCYESVIIGIYMENNDVKGVKFVDEHGIHNVGCKVIIDCTGDAEVCALIGCETMFGRNFDGRTQPFTSMKLYIKNNTVAHTNFDSGIVNQTNPHELTNAIVSSHASQLLEKYENGGERMLYLAPLIGIREGRRIVGEETIVLKDFLEGNMSDEPVFFAYADVDKHGKDNALESEIVQDWTVACNLGAVNICVPVPLKAMIPKGINGIIVAGRCISMDHDMLSCIRMERDMQKEGEIAAIAAKISIEKGYKLKDIPYDVLLPYLRKTLCFDLQNNVGYQFDGGPYRDAPVKIKWISDTEKLKEGLSSDKPGVALWSAKILGNSIKKELKEWIDYTDDNNIARHCAIALALIGDKSSLPIIRKMIAERDDFQLKDCRKNNQARGFIAIYLAGKLLDTEITDELIKIICDHDEFNKPLYHKVKTLPSGAKITDFNNMYFQFFSYSIISLIKIGDAFPQLRKKIGNALNNAVTDMKFIEKITRKSCESYEYSININLARIVAEYIDRWNAL